MDAFSAGHLSRALDRLHSTIYFVPEANERFAELGLDNQRMQYFASRSAPMGAVSAKVVAATFFNFNPELIAKAIPAAWDVASPAAVTQVRYEIVDAVLPKILGEERVRSPEFAHSMAIVRRTAEAIPNADGRPLYAGHAELDWPETPHAQLWHADHAAAGVATTFPTEHPSCALLNDAGQLTAEGNEVRTKVEDLIRRIGLRAMADSARR